MFRTTAALAIAALAIATPLSTVPATAQYCTASTEAYQINQDEANRLYDCIEAQIVENFADITGVPGVPDYRSWEVVSSSPLVSATHGAMMVNHIVNPEAAALYKKWEDMAGERFPPGTILAKESFRITASGEVLAGPLFLMEKVAPGGAPRTDDWIYTRVFDDGRVQRTLGPGDTHLVFCHDCHAATLDMFDGMFFPPPEFRVAVE